MSKYISILQKTQSVKRVQQVVESVSAGAQNKYARILSRLNAARLLVEKTTQSYFRLHEAENTTPTQHVMVFFSTYRELCGGLNHLLMQRTKQFIAEKELSSIQWIAAGRYHANLFGSMPNVIQQPIPESFMMSHFKPLLDQLMTLYQSGTSIWIAHYHFINYLKCDPIITTFLPISQAKQKTALTYYEPDQHTVKINLMRHYLLSLLYQIGVEQLTCEYNSRARNMRNASENSKDIIKALEGEYHKSRKNAITEELNEISGAFNIQ